MSLARSVKVALLVLAFSWPQVQFRSARALDGEAPAPPDSREDCDDCGGSGKTRCPKCKGKKKAPGPCRFCDERGKQACPSPGCASGRITCVICNGGGEVSRMVIVGYERVGKTVKYTRPIKKRKWVTCGPCRGTGRIKCTTCSGTAGVKCKKCRGKNVHTQPCDWCGEEGKVDCVRCNGEGKVGVWLLPPPDPRQPRSRQVVFLKESLAKALRLIQECNDRVSKSQEEFAKHKTRFGDTSTEFQEIDKLAHWSSSLKNKYGALDRRWRDCKEQFKKAAEMAGELLTQQQDEAGVHLEIIRELSKLLVEQDADVVVDRDHVRDENKFARRYRSRAALFQDQLESLSTTLERLESQVEEFQELQVEELKEDQRKVQARQAVETSFQSFQQVFPRLLSRTQLPDALCRLVDGSSAPGAITVEIKYVDPDADEGRRAEDVVPTESYLKELPGLISEAFDASLELQELIVNIWGHRTGVTGHDEVWRIQQFSAKREFWNELRTGQFHNDWVKLLSKSSPRPEFPRSSFISLDSPFAVILTIAVCFLALIVAVVARMRFA